jgi:hypothetical protein
MVPDGVATAGHPVPETVAPGGVATAGHPAPETVVTAVEAGILPAATAVQLRGASAGA